MLKLHFPKISTEGPEQGTRAAPEAVFDATRGLLHWEAGLRRIVRIRTWGVRL